MIKSFRNGAAITCFRFRMIISRPKLERPPTEAALLHEQNNDSDGDGAKPKCHDARAVK